MCCLWADRWRSFWAADVCAKWASLLRVTATTEAGEEGERSRRRVLIHIALAAWHLGVAMRQLPIGLALPPSMHHIVGHTVSRTGRLSPLIAGLGSCLWTLALLLRLAAARLTTRGDMEILERITRMVRDEPERGMRGAKVQACKLVHLLALVAWISVSLTGVIIVSGLFAVNALTAASWLEVICWSAWWVQDVASVAIAAADFAVLPAVYCLVSLDFLMEMRRFEERVNDCSQHLGTKIARIEVAVLLEAAGQMVREGGRVNRFTPSVLFAILLMTMPISVLCLFLALYSDNWFFTHAFPLVGLVVFSLACALMGLAARVTSASQRIHGRLCSLAQRASRRDTPLGQRILLLQVIECLGSEEQPLAMYTLTGEQYSSASFAVYLMETAVQFTLLFSFNAYAVYS